MFLFLAKENGLDIKKIKFKEKNKEEKRKETQIEKKSTFMFGSLKSMRWSETDPQFILVDENLMVMALPNLGSFSNPTATASPAGATASTSNPLSPSDDPSKKIRKPYTITKSRESWTEPEHDKFLEALQLWVLNFRTIYTASSLYFHLLGFTAESSKF